ncbi:MAG: transcription antitermination factor NusB [Desulfovibrio sp.]|jgi:N utilization substance protein B|nr:transcription antitermination factor NusB [Desulfovibrio sp.]
MSKGKKRRSERALAIQVLYGLSFIPVDSPDDLRRAFLRSPHHAGRTEEAALSGYAFTLVEGVWGKSAQLDEIIARHAINWRLDRLGRIELTLLRMAIFELLFCRDVPPKAVINEALELSRAFSGKEAIRFINGILDAAAKAAETGELAAGMPGGDSEIHQTRENRIHEQ